MAHRSDRRRQELWHQRRSLALARTSPVVVANTPAAALPHRWAPHDLAWERCQAEAAVAARAGDPIAPGYCWTRGLEIADRFFSQGDPRIATSLTNWAVVLRRRRRVHQAESMFAQALEAWDESWRWVYLMHRPPAEATEDAFARVYDKEARATFMHLVRLGRAASSALARQTPSPVASIELWLGLRPRRFSDLRKLLAAVLLIASRRD